MEKISRLLVSLLLLSLACQTFAGEITLKNGDRLTGKIVDETDDSIVLETEYAGKVKIARSHIEKVVSETPLNASAKPAAPPLIGKPAIPPPIQPASTVGVRESGRSPGRLRRVVTGWDGNANIGFSYTSGNSNNVTLSTGLRASKASPRDGLTVYARSLWNSNHGSVTSQTTQNAFWGGARYDRTIDKRWFGFVSYDFERDKPKRLAFRSVPGGGLGHRSIKNETTELEILLGGGWNRTWQADMDTNTPEALVGINFKRKLHDRLRLQNAFTYFQNVTDRSEYRFILDATVTAEVTRKVGFYISFGDRFNSDPIGTLHKNDFLFTTGMKWNFGKKK